VASLFTREFYERVGHHLKPDGLLVQWLHVYEFTPELLASIVKPLGDAFEDYAVYRVAGIDLILVASPKGMVGEAKVDLFAEPAVRERLARIGIESLTDLEARRVSGRNLFEQYLSVIPAPVNSDYFPFVDLNAPRARFMRASADAASRIGEGPVPLVEMLERRPLALTAPATKGTHAPARQRDMAMADIAADYLLSREASPEVPGDPGTDGADAIATARLVLRGCLPAREVDALWNRVVQVAIALNPVLPAGKAATLWGEMAHARCAQAFTAAQKTWLDLFQAVGARDAAKMADLADRLLVEKDQTDLQRYYLFNAAAAGRLALRQRGAARAVLEAAKRELPRAVFDRPWMQLASAWSQEPF
jgi:hypothetical protein